MFFSSIEYYYSVTLLLLDIWLERREQINMEDHNKYINMPLNILKIILKTY